MKNSFTFIISIIVLIMAGNALATDPGLPDSAIFGRLDKSNIAVGLGETVRVQLWIKTDDTVTFIHAPLATDNRYVVSRDGDSLFSPFSLWDDISFLPPDTASPISGWTSQSLFAFAYLTDPPDSQYWAMTNYQWWHVANYQVITTSDNSAFNVRTPLRLGFNRINHGMLFGLADGLTELVPAVFFDSLIFPVTGIEDDPQPLPEATALLGAYPNPFNSSTTIRFALSKPSAVDIAIYDITGQLVKQFSLGQMPAGDGAISWDGASETGGTVASGVYLYRMQAGSFRASSRLTLLK